MSGIPVPDVLGPGGHNNRNIATRMKVGDCMLDFTPSSAHSAAKAWSKTYPDKQFVARKLPDNVCPDLADRYGIWRLK
jgi:hypothetical protein